MPRKMKTIPKVKNRHYLDNADEPVETISETSLPQVKLTPKIAKEIKSQRVNLRTIASNLRSIKRKKAAKL